MELATARTVLGVSAADDWDAVRDAYRSLVRTTHPDVAGDAGIARTVEINTAYRTLAVARREGRLHDAPTAGTTTAGARTGPRARPAPPKSPTRRPPPEQRPSHEPADAIADDVRIVGGDTIVLSSVPAEAFRRLVEATHQLGEISYIDRSSAIFEAVLALRDGHHASFVVSLQWRAHDATCEAFCTLEALDRAEHLDVSGVLEQLAPMIPPDRDAPTHG